jgi:hypothetical protein
VGHALVVDCGGLESDREKSTTSAANPDSTGFESQHPVFQEPSMNNTPINNNDLHDLQWMAARYAHNRRSYSTGMINDITLKMIQNGIYPMPDQTREDAPEPTVWAKDGDFGWPLKMIEDHGWDGRKQRKTDAKQN